MKVPHVTTTSARNDDEPKAKAEAQAKAKTRNTEKNVRQKDEDVPTDEKDEAQVEKTVARSKVKAKKKEKKSEACRTRWTRMRATRKRTYLGMKKLKPRLARTRPEQRLRPKGARDPKLGKTHWIRKSLDSMPRTGRDCATSSFDLFLFTSRCGEDIN